MPGDNSKPDDWIAEDKLAVVIETTALLMLPKKCEAIRGRTRKINILAGSTDGHKINNKGSDQGARQRMACEIVGISSRALLLVQHWPEQAGKSPANSQENNCQQTQ